MISRRKFIRNVAASTLVTVLPVSGCSVAGKAVAKTVGKWFLRFAVDVGAGVASDQISGWVDRQREADRSVIDIVRIGMEQLGFVNSEDRSVYDYDGTSFFELGHKDQFNGCAAFFNGQKYPEKVPIAEGPSIIAMALAAEELRTVQNNSQLAIAKSLVPIEQSQKPNVSAFGSNFDQPLIAKTHNGSFEINYSVQNGNQGLTSIAIYSSEQQLIFGREYSIEFAE